MIYPIYFPDKEESDRLKAILQETKGLTGIPYWRYLLTLCAEDLAKRRTQELTNKAKGLK